MQIIFQGKHDTDEAVDSLASILNLFKERYAIHGFSAMHLNVTLLDTENKEVELVDVATSEVLAVFEVQQSQMHCIPIRSKRHLSLVVDNTKPKQN